MEPGHKLAQYRITGRIGAGGMGEVYAAHDTNLERDVAVKVLPRDLADNASRLARLEREAKAIAALSHPNILAVYDFGSEEGTTYLVTELLEGETLRDRLLQGGLAPRKAAEYGRQIARGLAAAHDKGIVHRDLKPENIYLTHDGRVKILDFGLASAAGSDPAASPDVTVELGTRTKLTAPGAVLGTVDYMAPEQVRGLPTDSRSDLFSFGSVLYEMVTGARPFHRETGAETMTAILKEEPPELPTLAADLPPALAAIIRRCLEKRPGERFHSAHDLAFSLEALSGSAIATGSNPALTGVGSPRRRPPAALVAGLVAVGLLVGAAAAWFLRPQPEPPGPVSYTNLSSRRGKVTNARFSGGDLNAIYSASWAGGPIRLYPAAPGTRSSEALTMGDADLLSVASTGELAVALDRRHSLGWEAVGTLAVAQPGGAAPRPLLQDVFVADWSPDGRSLAVAHEVGGVVRLEYPIGTVLHESPGWISDLRVHPDGEQVLIVDCPARGDNMGFIRIVHRDGRVEDVGPGGSWGALWAPDGRTIWHSTGGNVFRMRPGGRPEAMLGLPSPMRLLDVAPGGQVLAAPATIRRELLGRAPDDLAERDLSWQDWSTPSAISEDGRLAVFDEGNDVDRDGYAVYLRRTDGAPPQRLGSGSGLAIAPDGAWVALKQRLYREDSGLVLVPTGPGEPRPLNVAGMRILNHRGAWIAGLDGEAGFLVAGAQDGDGAARLYRIALDGTTPPRALTPAAYPLAAYGHVVSLDGRRIVALPAGAAAVEFDGDGQGPRPLPGLLPTDLPLQFDRDGRHLYVQAAIGIPSPIVRVDTATGERTPWLELSPRDPAGVVSVDRVQISADGRAYIYSIRRHVSWLVLVDGFE